MTTNKDNNDDDTLNHSRKTEQLLRNNNDNYPSPISFHNNNDRHDDNNKHHKVWQIDQFMQSINGPARSNVQLTIITSTTSMITSLATINGQSRQSTVNDNSTHSTSNLHHQLEYKQFYKLNKALNNTNPNVYKTLYKL